MTGISVVDATSMLMQAQTCKTTFNVFLHLWNCLIAHVVAPPLPAQYLRATAHPKLRQCCPGWLHASPFSLCLPLNTYFYFVTCGNVQSHLQSTSTYCPITTYPKCARNHLPNKEPVLLCCHVHAAPRFTFDVICSDGDCEAALELEEVLHTASQALHRCV